METGGAPPTAAAAIPFSSSAPPSHQQKDVFETDDLPEQAPTENIQNLPEVANENIERGSISSNDAFKRFNSKLLDTSKEDYSDSVRRRRMKKGGFIAGQTDFEILPAPMSEETPLQRFHRLQYEVKSMIDDLKGQESKDSTTTQKEKGTKVDLSSAPTYSQLHEELLHLEKEMQLLVKDQKLQSLLDPKYELERAQGDQGNLSKKLLHHIQSLQQPGQAQAQDQKGSTTSTKGAQQEGVVTYELFYTPEQSKHLQLTKLADVERRLDHLEQLLTGGKPLQSTTIPFQTDLVTAVDALRERLVLLSSPSHLDALQRKAKQVQQDLQQLLDKQSSLPPSTAQDKRIDELYEMMSRWDTTSQQLPALVTRLQSLRNLHEESANFASLARTLETQQEDIKKMLKNNSELTNQVQTSFKNNLSVVQSNVDVLEKRFSELSKKMDALK